MPRFEYECQRCGYLFDVFQPITDEALKACLKPGCNGEVQRISLGSKDILFKDAGFVEPEEMHLLPDRPVRAVRSDAHSEAV